MYGAEEKSKFDEERKKQEEAAAKGKKYDKDDKEQKQTDSRKKSEKEWKDKRKLQEAREMGDMRQTSTSRQNYEQEFYESEFDDDEKEDEEEFNKEENMRKAMIKIKENLPQFNELNSPFASEMDEDGSLEDEDEDGSLGPLVDDLISVRKSYPKMKAREIDFRINEEKNLEVSEKGKDKWKTLFLKNGKLRTNLSKELKELLGPTREEISAQEELLDYKTKFEKERKRNNELESFYENELLGNKEEEKKKNKIISDNLRNEIELKERISVLEKQEKRVDISKEVKDNIEKEKKGLKDKLSDLIIIINELRSERARDKTDFEDITEEKNQELNRLAKEHMEKMNQKELDIRNLESRIKSGSASFEKREQFIDQLFHERDEMENEFEKEFEQYKTRNEELETKIKNMAAQKIVTVNEERIEELDSRQQVLNNQLEYDDLMPEMTLEEINKNYEEIEERNKIIIKEKSKMTLKFRVKEIFKKYGLTILGISSVVATVIGVIITNLTSGLASLGKTLGKALKNVSKKVAAILPGMAGAIVSFIFKSAGEVVTFIGKNSWLLIMAIVIFIIGEFKKKNK